MFRTTVLMLCLIAVAITVIKANIIGASSRIVGGRLLPIKGAPYIVQLRNDEGFFCAGTLIAKRFVVTAAHCMDRLDYTKVVVVGGATTIDEHGVQRNVVDAFVSAEYDEVTNNSDVVVLKLDGDMEGENIGCVALCSKSLRPRDYLQVSGWGRISEDGPFSQTLRTVNVQVMDQDECVRLHYKGEVTDSMMCANGGSGRDACTSDSGGPAIHLGELCGIVSWGIGCGRMENPGVYTRIDQVRWFIDAVMEM